MKDHMTDLTIKRISLGLILAAVLVLVALAVGSNEASGNTITVDDDGGADYESIQDAIDNATDGDTVRVYDGYFLENIIVNKSISLIGNGSETTTVDGGGIGDVLRIMADMVNMSGFLVTGSGNQLSDSGIHVLTNHNHIFSNYCINNGNGIYFNTSINGIITDNVCSENDQSGILILDSNCIITDNECSENDRSGILILDSNCTITNNACIGNYDRGIHIENSEVCIITNNRCNNNSMGISLDSSIDCILENNTCSSNWDGIFLDRSGDCTIASNTCSENNYNGIKIRYCFSGCTITNNICLANKRQGIHIEHSNNCKSENNTCENNIRSGIFLDTSGDCTIANNNCSKNHRSGIYLWQSGTCILDNNTCFLNNRSGMRFESSGNCTITRNTCSTNDEHGIHLMEYSNCIIKNNTITGNGAGILLEQTSLNNAAHYNRIYNNTEYGIDASDNNGFSINATLNYFGSNTGPYNPTKNPGGKGDTITDYVDFDPWECSPRSCLVLYVDDNAPDGGNGSKGNPFNHIQDAIDNAADGDTVRVWDGYYDESVVVNKSINLMGNGSETTTIDGGKIYDDVVTIEADWVYMSGFRILADRYYGTGIKVTSDNITISNNSIDMINSTGIYLYYSSSCKITNNTLIDSGILLEGDIENWNSHDIVNNLQNGKPVHYYKNTSDLTVPFGARQIILANCTRIVVEDQNCSNGLVGILVGYSSDTTIENNTCSNHGRWKGWGILLYKSSDCAIMNNTCENNSYGIHVDSCEDIIIENNSCQIIYNLGIYLDRSSDCSITNNKCDMNIQAIQLSRSNHCEIANNTCWYNRFGISLHSSNDCTIEYNDCEINGGGIILFSSSNCTIVKNICIENNGGGIHLIASNTCRIQSNECRGNKYGISLSFSGVYCLLKNNTCSMNEEEGIYLGDSDHCTVEMNTCEDNQYGIFLTSSECSTIRNNVMSGNGIFIYGTTPGEWNLHDIEPNNMVNGKPILYYSNITDFTVPVGAGQIILAKCSLIVIEDQDYSNVSVGILVGFSDNITIENTTSMHNLDGISLYFSDDCFIKNTICSRNNETGIGLRYSFTCVLENNICESNGNGIFIDSSNLCIIERSEIRKNGVGIHVKGYSRNNTAHYNNIYDNTDFGIDATHNNGYFINATNNWWGDESGPFHSANNTNGTGDNVTDNVIFDPWLDEYYTSSEQAEDEPDRLLLYIMLVILLFLFIAVEIVVRTPDSVFSKKRSPAPSLQETDKNQEQPDPVTSNRRSITCKYCHKTYDLGENEKAIQVPCPHCGKNNLR